MAIGRAVSLDDADVALLFTELGETRLRLALSALLDRRLVAGDALNRFVRGREMTVAMACARLQAALRGAISSIAGSAGASARVRGQRSGRRRLRAGRARDRTADGAHPTRHAERRVAGTPVTGLQPARCGLLTGCRRWC